MALISALIIVFLLLMLISSARARMQRVPGCLIICMLEFGNKFCRKNIFDRSCTMKFYVNGPGARTASAHHPGLKGYITNTELTKDQIISNYGQLWQIEKTFRISKTDL